MEGLYLKQKGSPLCGTCFFYYAHLYASKLAYGGGRIASLKLAIH
jgi:hypothetical protein